MPPLVRPTKRPSPLFAAKAGSRAVSLEIGCVNHEGLGLGPLGGRAFHHLHEYAQFAPQFQRLYNGLCGPYPLGASRQRSRYLLTKRIPLSTCLSSIGACRGP